MRKSLNQYAEMAAAGRHDIFAVFTSREELAAWLVKVDLLIVQLEQAGGEQNRSLAQNSLHACGFADVRAVVDIEVYIAAKIILEGHMHLDMQNKD
jgi:hypothetical protein